MPPYLYIDSNILIQQGRNLQSADLSLIEDLANAKSIELISTDLTQEEIKKKFVSNSMKELGDLGRPVTRNLALGALNIKLPDIEVSEIKAKLNGYFRTLIRNRFRELRIRVVAVDTVQPSVVFRDYHDQKGMFSATAKKSQFPDAFIMHCLLQNLKKQQRLLVLSKDADYLACAREHESVVTVTSTDDVLKELGYQISDRDVEKFLEHSKNKIVSLAQKEVLLFGLEISDVEDAEVEEFSISDVEFSIDHVFDSIQSGDEVTIFGVADFSINVAFIHPDWSSAIRDSDTKEFFAFDSVSGDIDTTLSVPVTIRAEIDANNDLIEITQLALNNRYGLNVDIDLWEN